MNQENRPSGEETGSTSQSSASAGGEGTDLVAVPERSFFQTDDCWAILLGMVVLLIGLGSVHVNLPASDISADASAAAAETDATSSEDGSSQSKDEAVEADETHSFLKPYLAKPGSWKSNPAHSLGIGGGKPGTLLGILGVLVISMLLFVPAVAATGSSASKFIPAFLILFSLAIVAYILAGQSFVKEHSLSYAMWALLSGLVISNTIGTPVVLKPAIRTELFIKTGLVILGAEILVTQLMALGLPGIFVAWVVTPIVLVTTFWFGQKILKLESPSLNMVISADMCVCGVSAAIATAAACKAKKEELSAAIGLSLIFTVIMMIVMPGFIRMTGMSEVLGGAWVGGTIDATGAVALAGAELGPDALKVASTVKMIQNILIGVIAFGVSIYWVRFQEKGTSSNVTAGEIWKRFPKFVLGFVAASALFSWIYAGSPDGQVLASTTIGEVSKALRGWFFCLAFVAIGLESNFSELAKQFRGGRPLVLYIAGQTLNLILTLGMAWLMFEQLFPETVAEALKP